MHEMWSHVGLQYFITLCTNLAIYITDETSDSGTAHNGKFNAVYEHV